MSSISILLSAVANYLNFIQGFKTLVDVVHRVHVLGDDLDAHGHLADSLEDGGAVVLSLGGLLQRLTHLLQPKVDLSHLKYRCKF